MSFKLQEFNDTNQYPTLKKFVDSFENGWLDQIHLLESDSEKAKKEYRSLINSSWAINQMILLYDNQISLLYETKKVIMSLKGSDLYQWENGSFQQAYTSSPYQKILQSIIATGRAFERHPSTYSDKDEESLRDFIIVALQNSTDGSVTGETFNKNGKTDILIRSGNDSIFIGECKFWHGKASYLKAISQLLGYLTWRDNNAAIIIFVKNNNFSNVLENIINYTSQHSNFMRTISYNNIAYEFEFFMNEDNQRTINLSVVLFHIPKIS